MNEILKQFAKGQNKKLKLGSKKAVIYTRVSSKEQAEGNNSLQWQMSLCIEYAKKNGYEVVTYFGGTHESAKTEDRKQYKAMLDFVKKSKDVSYIIVYSMDRFGRSGAESIAVIETLRKTNVYVLSVTQPVDQESQSGKMMTDFQLMLSKWDNDNRRQKTIDGMRNKLLRGDWCGNVPTGYAFDKTSTEQKIVFSEKAKYIKQAFKMKLAGKSNPEIIKALKAKSYTIPLQLLSDIFRNVFYCGFYSHNLLNGELIKGKQPPMITEKEFALINGMLKTDGFKQKKAVDALPLKVTGRCAECELPLTGYLVVKKNIYYYKCRKRGCKCNVSATSLHVLFEEQLNQLQISDKHIAPIKKELNYIFKEITKGKSESVAALKKSLYDVQQKLEKAEERHAIGDVSREIYERVRGKLTEEKSQIEREIEKIGNASSNYEKTIDACMSVALKPASTWASAANDDKLYLQRAIFPRGFGYDKKNHRVLTSEPNVIFQLIKAVSDNCGQKKNGSSDISIKTSRLVPETGLEPVRP